MTVTPYRLRERTAQRTQKATSAERLDADVWRRRAQQWPEYAAELLDQADRAERSQTAAA